jgi:hypothetical protein
MSTRPQKASFLRTRPVRHCASERRLSFPSRGFSISGNSRVFSTSGWKVRTLKEISRMIDTTQSDNGRKETRRPFDHNRLSHPDDTGDKSRNVAKSSAAVPPQLPLKTKRGQKHIAPSGRHSQQTHRRAEARAAAQGHATEKEQHAHDRSIVVGKLGKQAAHQLKQQQDTQDKRSARQKGSEPGNKQEESK